MEDKLLFAHDGHISVNSQGVFSDIYNNEIIERYFNISSNVTFIVRRGMYNEERKLNKITKNNFKVIGVENFNSLKGILSNKKIKKIVEKEVLESKYIIARLPSKLGFLAVRFAKKHKKKYMIEVVGCPWDSLRNHSIKGKIIAPIYYFQQKKAVKSSPRTIYVTNRFLQERYPSKGKIIGCSDVQIKNMDKKILENRYEKILNTNVNTLTLGTIGALNMKYKGFDTVIKSLSRLNKEGYSFKYEIIGSGDPTWLKSVVKKNEAEKFITINLHVSHEKIFTWLDSLDLYIQPSKTEGMPRALIEALSRGVPALGTKAGGISELLKEKYLLSNNKKNIKELNQFLKSIDKNSMISQSKRNFKEAEKYKIENIEIIRNQFYKEFVDEGVNND